MDQLLSHIRPAVRAQRPYVVGGIDEPRIKLNQNENPYDLPEDLKRELVEAFLAIPFNRYPKEQPDRLQAAYAEAVGHEADGVIVGNGSNELTHLLGLTLVGPETPVVLPRPMFALYESVVRLFAGRLVSVAPREDLHFDADALVEAVRRERPSLTVVASPNNPTGLAMTHADVERLLEAAEGFVVVDEAYVEFNEEGSVLPLMARHPNLMVLRTLSKAFGLAGLRVGFLLARPEVTQHLLKARLPFMVDRLAETVALALLERPALLRERVAEMKGGSAALVAALEAVDGVTVVPSQANFVLFKTGLEPGSLMHRLASSGVLVRNMSGYPELQGYLRVNTGTPAENKAFLTALKRAL